LSDQSTLRDGIADDWRLIDGRSGSGASNFLLLLFDLFGSLRPFVLLGAITPGEGLGLFYLIGATPVYRLLEDDERIHQFLNKVRY